MNTINIEVQHNINSFNAERAYEQDNYVIDAFDSIDMSEAVIKDIKVNKADKTATLTIHSPRTANDFASLFSRDGNRIVFFSETGTITDLPPKFSH